ncbi:GMC family oxidoreductase [Pseudomonas fluorescens]|uniref:Alcohol dehydrogenase [acceptor] n=1 Tax=Pseudomonas fluorescens TaxID=294 RepID=A0A5E7EGA5_PSEFL|nr:GMC family oxidoreductase N-terminal domain-containing protein [Pseudomonas fluorescens]VVO25622.1 Alcohol dehydrogenase [acceptor] [Pseudomonas fluorescens]
MSEAFDYIVVGAGSAGCVVAARLIQAKAGKVLLLEAGTKDNSPFHSMPATVVKVFQQKSWPYMTVPQVHCNNREMIIAQGKVLGGGSSVNGMIYIRGQHQDYDDWANQWGCVGWSYDDVLPFFKKAEANESLGDQYHGQDGPLPVSENRYRHPLTMAFVRAGQELGVPYVNDFNGARQEGIGFYQTTTRNGARASTARTYLKAVKGDGHLTVVTDALVHKVLIDQGVAVGVEYSGTDGRTVRASARREVVVSAGTIGSPKVLMLSGVGPREHLEVMGIECLVDAPVGKNFHDHLHMSVNATIHGDNSFFGEDKGLRALKHVAQWLTTRTGLMTSNILEGGAFVDTCEGGRPDIQLHFLPVLDNFDNTPGEKAAAGAHGLTIKVGHLQPKSRGQVLLSSRDPQAPIRIDANFMADPHDVAGQIRAVQLGLKMLQQPALAKLVKEVIEPNNVRWDDTAAIEKWMRQNIKTVYHPAGTCRIGTDPATSVTDLQLRVHGVERLRVVDCSICPQVPSGNTNAPSIMIGERGAHFILNP